MNKSEDERFCELAHKAIAKRAEAQELAELETMLEDSRLQRKFEMMKVEVALLKEALPLSEDIEQQYVRGFDIPLERLRREVRSVFEQRSGPKARVDNLLGELSELVASGRNEAERERGVALLAALEEFLTRPGPLEQKTDSPELKTDAPERGRDVHYEKALTDWIIERRSRWRRAREKAEGAEAELQHKLMTMENRLNNALTHLNNCKDEALILLNLIREEKNALGRKIAEKREKGP